MPSHTVDYSRFGDDHIAKHNAAIQDIKDYLGEEKFDEINAELVAGKATKPLTLDEFTFLVGFAGIRGFPAKAWYNHVYGL